MLSLKVLPTLDLEFIKIEKERANPKLYIYLILCVDKKIKW